MAGRLRAVATKARHLKTPLQLWIADNRKRLSLEPADLARLTGVTEATVRGWESRGRPSEDALAVLERRFGLAAPREAQASGYGSDVALAIREQTAALVEAIQARDKVIEALLSELATYRRQTVERQTVERSLLEALPEAIATALAAMRADDPVDEPREAHQVQ